MERSSHPCRISRRDFVKGTMGALATSFFVGCSGGDPTGPRTSTQLRLAARPGTPTLAPTIGSTPLGLGGARDGLLYVPASYSPDSPAPLLVMLHGATGEGSNWASYEPRAEQRGFVLLAPDSRARTWELATGGFGGVLGDIDFIDAALAHTFERCRIDPTRIVFGGFSDGASYALSAGLSNGDLFTHLIGFSPGFVQRFDPLIGKPPVFVSHGNADPILSFAQSRDVIVPRLRDDGHDVTWFPFDGGHLVPAEVSEAALDWFEQT